jgi:itaconate CoA-transferase
LIVETFAALTADAVLTRLDAAGIANATVREMRDVWNHPQFVSGNRWNQIQTPAGTIAGVATSGDP